MLGVQFTSRRRTDERLRLFLGGARVVLNGAPEPSILTTAGGVLDVAHVEPLAFYPHASSDPVGHRPLIRFLWTRFFGGSEAGASSAAE